MIRQVVSVSAPPPPAGTYSQAIVAGGEFLFVSGQTPRLADGTRIRGAFRDDARQAMENLKIVAEAAGYDLRKHFAKAVIYLSDMSNKTEFDSVFAEYVGEVPPARSIVQSSFTEFTIEVEGIFAR